ncbi:DNA polymerase IV [Halorientalis sp. IM1011]|uniref:DNA polymerase IV n=1 Tax=Halorientalis sp. IM1011 TaxID=1932360 RepID=UPI00097CCB02|nr:DNA polymerase IV [Halorientalis sp. IM1011]AQL41221.1 DNA polymerase IV [Halorientalis sp. IM1011]
MTLDEFTQETRGDRREQVICHVDMDCFYAACERLREPELEGEPLVVGMGYESGEPHGAVATASYEAREFGVESAMAISQALERLPRHADADATDDDAPDPDEAGYYRTVDLDYYESVASEVKEILHDTADTVREVSIDEAYLDVTETVDWESADEFGQRLRDRIEDEVGVVASVGIAPAMSAAKIASDHDKPDGLVVVEPGDVREFLAPLDVEEVHNVGPVTARELRSMGVETAGDLAEADPDRLGERFGERGREIRSYARGEDDRPVEPVGKPKSLSRESAFTDATDDPERKRDRVRALAGDVAERARRKDALYRTIGIKVVTPPFDVHTRAESLPGPVEDADLVEEVALDLLAEFSDDDVRKVGVRVSNLDFSDAQQASLDGFEDAEPSGGDSRENRSLGEFEADGRDEPEDGDPQGQTSLGEFQ